MLLFGGASAIGFQPSYAADRTVATWSELADAFQTAPSGDTIIISADITQTSGTLYLPEGVSLTLDLHGYKLSITAPPSQGAPGVGVYGNSSLTIEDGVGGGVLNTTGSPNGFGAGIGADNNKTAGTIIINSGTITAVGSPGGAGIGGGGLLGSNGTVIINGGTVNAIGNNGAAGIGGGAYGSGGTVIINGGNVSATGNNGGAGIGAGYSEGSYTAAGAEVTITGGTVTVSTGNTLGYSAIGGRPFGSLNNSGGTIVLPSGHRLIIPSGVTFENAGTIEGGGTLTGAGTVHNTGTISSNVSGVAVNGNAYDLTFDLNGAPGMPPSSLHVLASTMQAAGKSLAIPAPSGYEFDGWYTSTGTLFTNTTPISSITSTGSATLYAKWKDFKIVSVVPISDIHVAYDAPLGTVALPATVNVTLSNGETKTTAVTWNGGTPAYNGSQPGTYVFAGTLTVPEGSSNPDGITASITVVVEDPIITSVDPLSDIHVPYGTELEDVELPTTVNVTLSSGDTEQATVTWNGGVPAYNGTLPGTYTFSGTLTAPVGSTNPNGITASVNVIVEDPTVISVDALSDIHVPYGTELEDVGLPPTVDVTLSSGDTEQATVTWNGSVPAYNGDQPGTYSFTGTLTTPAGSTNPGGLTASINVVVEDPIVTSVDALSDIHVPYGTELGDVGLPPTVDVTLSSGDTEQATVTWNGGVPAYNGTLPGTYTFSGTLTASVGSTNPNGITASITVVVEDPTVISVDALSDIHVPYGTELEDVGLPTTVNVTLSSGDTEQATVTWNGGTPVYTGNQPGKYMFTGTLTAPVGSTNPNGITASITVVVEDPTVISVDALSDIHVPYGTELEDVGLPPTVDVTLSSGDTEQATVTWNGGVPAYNGTLPGTFTFTGTLTAPVGSTNPNGITASITVVVEDPTVISVDPLSDIRVTYGTRLDNVKLPTTVEVTLSSGDKQEASIAWDGGDPAYNGTKSGKYTFTGMLTPSAGAANPDNMTASVNVIVDSARSSETAPATGPLATSKRIYCETGGCTISLGDQIEVSVPPKAANLPFYLTLEMLETDEVQLPDGAQWLSQVFRLSRNVEDQPLQLPMTLLIRLESTKIGEGRRAALFAYDESTGKWTEVIGSLAGEVFTAQTDKFAEFAVLSVAKQTPPSQPQPEEPGILLSDITGHWAEAEIKAAVAKGIVTGYQDGTFRPNQQVSRVEFAALLNRALKLIGSEGASENPQSEFTDAASIPTWARSSVTEATAQGLIRGFADGTFRPGELISRTEMAVIAARALHLSEAPDSKLAFVDANEIPVWARDAVAAVQRAGLINGKNGNRFDPRAPVTRAEAAGLIIRMMEQD
ncbi:Ig-like domain-containing protein [Cohnella sp.]|uniref:Ig-like domain-containing protein n=1 Tax=Cohnella sp. TaxID=1883426 RepID=UPI0035699EA3